MNRMQRNRLSRASLSNREKRATARVLIQTLRIGRAIVRMLPPDKAWFSLKP